MENIMTKKDKRPQEYEKIMHKFNDFLEKNITDEEFWVVINDIIVNRTKCDHLALAYVGPEDLAASYHIISSHPDSVVVTAALLKDFMNSILRHTLKSSDIFWTSKSGTLYCNGHPIKQNLKIKGKK